MPYILFTKIATSLVARPKVDVFFYYSLIFIYVANTEFL